MVLAASDILLGISNYDNNNDVTILKFVIWLLIIIFTIVRKSGKPIDFYNFQMNLKTRMIIEEFRSNMFNNKCLKFQEKWSVCI